MTIEQQIYQDVFSSEDKFLSNVQSVLDGLDTYDEKTYNKLKDLDYIGFSNLPEVKNWRKNVEIKRREMEKKERIEYYKKTYPFHKFIASEDVWPICEKYSLVCHRVNKFIGEIPEKNKLEILNFRIKEKDMYIDLVGASEKPVRGRKLQILAPSNQFLKEPQKEILTDDPIVLQPVEYGFLIVTSWGLESNDNLIINPTLN